MKTKLEYQPDITETNKLICEKYWLRERDKRNGFIYTCKEIGQEFGFRHKEISSIAKENAQLVVLDCQCMGCGLTKTCHTRTQLIQLNLDNWRCDVCWDVLKEIRMKESLKQHFEQECLEEEQRQSVLKYINNYRDNQLASDILNCMEAAITQDVTEYSVYGSDTYKQVYVYGALNRGPITLNRNFGFAWGVNGFLLFNALGKLGADTVMSMRKRVAEEITTTFASSYTHEVSLAEVLHLQSIAAYGKQATGEKYLITPQK